MDRPMDVPGARPLQSPADPSGSGARRLVPGYDDQASLGELFSRMTDDVSTLVSKEIQLAKVEIREEATKAAKGAGMLGAGALVALYALLLLSFAAAWGLAAVMPTGFAFLIMAVLYLLVAGGLVVTGRKELKSMHPKPEQTVQTLKEDAQWAKQQMS